jgi:hypothetical protein
MTAALVAAGIVVSGLAACASGLEQPSAAPPMSAAPPTTSAPVTTAALATSAVAAPITDVAQLSPVCPLLDGEQVGARFGSPATTGVESPMQRLENGAEAAQCMYVAGETAIAVLTVSIGRGSTISPQDMIAAIRQQSGNGEPVDGVGAAALFHTMGEAALFSSANTVGGVPVLISLSGPITTPRETFQPLVAGLVARF